MKWTSFYAEKFFHFVLMFSFELYICLFIWLNVFSLFLFCEQWYKYKIFQELSQCGSNILMEAASCYSDFTALNSWNILYLYHCSQNKNKEKTFNHINRQIYNSKLNIKTKWKDFSKYASMHYFFEIRWRTILGFTIFPR
jgi:hypothetical protein